MLRKQFLVGLAKYGLGLGLLAFIIWWNWTPAADGSSPGISGIIQRPLQIGPLLAAVLLCSASVLLTFLRWYWLVRAQELPFTPGNALRLGLVGFFLSTFLPGSVGGDLIKAVCLAKQQQRRTVAVATVIMDRIVGLWALIWLVALLGFAFWLAGDPALAVQAGEPATEEQVRLQTLILSTLGLAGGTSLGWALLMLLPAPTFQRLANRLDAMPRLGPSLAELWRAVWMYRNQWRSVLAALLLSLVSHGGFVLTFYFSARTFLAPGELPSLTEHFLLVPLGMTFQAMIPLPGGVGAGEVGFAWLYELVGKQGANGVVGSFTQRLLMLGLGFIGYLVYLRMLAEVMAVEQEVLGEEAAKPTEAEAAVQQVVSLAKPQAVS